MNKKKSAAPKTDTKRVLKFPARKQPDFFSGQDTYDVLEREKIKIKAELRVLMRLPRLMTRGVHEEFEFLIRLAHLHFHLSKRILQLIVLQMEYQFLIGFKLCISQLQKKEGGVFLPMLTGQEELS